jgi:hypothetical protein
MIARRCDHIDSRCRVLLVDAGELRPDHSVQQAARKASGTSRRPKRVYLVQHDTKPKPILDGERKAYEKTFENNLSGGDVMSLKSQFFNKLALPLNLLINF